MKLGAKTETTTKMLIKIHYQSKAAAAECESREIRWQPIPSGDSLRTATKR